MISTNKALLTFTISLMLFSGCKKEDQKDESAPSFTAIMNGRSFETDVAVGSLLFINPTQQRIFLMLAHDESSSIHISFFDDKMNQDVKNNLSIIPDVQYSSNTQHNANFVTISHHVEFSKFDSTTKLLDGTFSLVAFNNSNNTTVTISDGKFKNIPYSVKTQD